MYVYSKGNQLRAFGTTLPPNKDQTVKKIEDVKEEDYDVLVIPGGVKSYGKG